MSYKIIDASQIHVKQIAKLEQICFSMPWTEDSIKSQMPDDRHIFIVAVEDDEVLGYVGMAYIIDEGYISNVAVAPEYRRKGVADALMLELFRRSNELKLSFVTLEVRESNAPAISLYEKYGFSPVGRRKNYYDFPKEDAILMTKFF